MLEIQRQAQLVTVEHRKVRAIFAWRPVAKGRQSPGEVRHGGIFDLDDGGSHICEQHGAKWPGVGPAEIKDRQIR